MGERKLKAGYVRWWLKARDDEKELIRNIPIIIRESDKAWRPEKPLDLGPDLDLDKCYEDSGPPAHTAATAELKFQVGQWVKSLDGQVWPIDSIGRFLDGSPIYARRPEDGVSMIGYPESMLAPHAPVCTEAQLAIRVGDEVRVRHNWSSSGKPDAALKIDQGTHKVVGIGQLPGDFIMATLDSIFKGPDIGLWNLEPVCPRA